MPGRPPETSDHEYLEFIDGAAAPFVFTSEAAAEFSVSQQGAYARLSTLREQGAVDAKTGKETGWWLTEQGRCDVRD